MKTNKIQIITIYIYSGVESQNFNINLDANTF